MPMEVEMIAFDRIPVLPRTADIAECERDTSRPRPRIPTRARTRALHLHTAAPPEPTRSVHGWSLEPFSPRQAMLLAATLSDRPGAIVHLGHGRGDAIYLGRAIEGAHRARALELRYYAFTPDRAPIAIGLVLTNAHARPWLQHAPLAVALLEPHMLRFDLGCFHPARLARIDRACVALVSSAGQGFVVLDDLTPV